MERHNADSAVAAFRSCRQARYRHPSHAGWRMHPKIYHFNDNTGQDAEVLSRERA